MPIKRTLKANACKAYTKAEIDYIAEAHSRGVTAQALGNDLGRSENAIACKLWEMGVHVKPKHVERAISVPFDAPELAALRQEANEEGVSMRRLIQNIVVEYLNGQRSAVQKANQQHSRTESRIRGTG